MLLSNELLKMQHVKSANSLISWALIDSLGPVRQVLKSW